MTNDEEYELKFRDQCAISAMQALLNAKGRGKYYTEDNVGALYIDKMTLLAYHIADAMRKARLQSFT